MRVKTSKKNFNKYNDGIFWDYKGFWLWKHHAYQSNRKSNEIMLMSNSITPTELYFKNWRDAKNFVRRLAHNRLTNEEKIELGITEKYGNDTNFNYSDLVGTVIPF